MRRSNSANEISVRQPQSRIWRLGGVVGGQIDTALYWGCVLLMASMVFVILLEVTSRYLFGSSISWTSELGRYIFIWTSLLATVVGVRKGAHLALDILPSRVSKRASKIFDFVIETLVLFLGVLVTSSGFLYMKGHPGEMSATLGISMQYVFVIIPITGILIVLSSAARLILPLRSES